MVANPQPSCSCSHVSTVSKPSLTSAILSATRIDIGDPSGLSSKAPDDIRQPVLDESSGTQKSGLRRLQSSHDAKIVGSSATVMSEFARARGWTIQQSGEVLPEL